MLNKVCLREEQKQGRLHYFIEKFVLWRLQTWKNNPRVNALVWKAVLSVIAMGLIGLLVSLYGYFLFQLFSEKSEAPGTLFQDIISIKFKSWVKLGLILSGSITLAYWNMSNMFNKKWDYCADLYNKIFSAKSEQEKKYLRNALAIDLLTLDLWAHRSFSSLFKSELLLAAKFYYNEDSYPTEEKKIREGHYSESEAAKILEALNEQYSKEPIIPNTQTSGS